MMTATIHHSIECLERCSLFRMLGSGELEELSVLGSSRRYPKGNILYYQGDAASTVYVVVSGEVKISLLNEDGREVMIDLVRSGGVAGFAALLDDGPRLATAITQSTTVLIRFERSRLLAWIERRPEVQHGFRIELARELRLAYARVGEHALMPVRERLLGALVEIAARDGIAETHGRCVAFTRPTHQELAERIGTSREVVTRLLRSLAESGLLEAQGRVIRVPESALIIKGRDEVL